ncbi:hypothetical protein F7725_001462 [Dissostichus mawsoni]|uniref:Integrator complex subunit 11 n=1 Tax=Dissostichus mawsoni TaxID=36200 RepID=A0A7J5ZKI7_DISMA|nr:hypothetical protein F7725_001462 [Dissostichus mawsoni]
MKPTHCSATFKEGREEEKKPTHCQGYLLALGQTEPEGRTPPTCCFNNRTNTTRNQNQRNHNQEPLENHAKLPQTHWNQNQQLTEERREMVGYDGPIYMTHPTKAICPILLEDFRKITVDKKGETNFFTSQMIKDCMKKVVPLNLHQTVQVDDELEIKAYYAGHVLGAAMVQIKVGSESVVYTGDYNMTPDRHLGAAWIDKCRPDVLISESTYATTIRDSKRCRERDFLKKVHESIERGGKVLIPVFALGRAQELCILLETFWERMNLKAPIYFSTGLTEKANHYYKLFITWTNQKIRKTFVQRNMFEFKHIKAFDRSYADNPGPMVIMPGYCVQGTIGHKILNGQRKLELEGRSTLEVKLQVEYMSFSAHADAKGIMQLIRMAEPRNVLLVHGEASLKLVSSEQALKDLGLNEHQLRFTCRVQLQDQSPEQETLSRVYTHLRSVLKGFSVQLLPDGTVMVESILIKVSSSPEDPDSKTLLLSWSYQDEDLGSFLSSLLKKGLPAALC